MKKNQKNHPFRGRLRVSFLSCILATSVFLVVPVSADLINVNLTDTSPSGLFSDGPGILGAGTWNRIIDGDAALTNPLFNSGSVLTPANFSQSSGTPVVGRTQGNGNPVQNESWEIAGGFVLTITGLMPSHIYKVAVYSDKIGSGLADDTYVVGGAGVTLPNPGASPMALPGINGVDYAIFIVNSTSAGQLSIYAPGAIAGFQLQGVISSNEAGPKMDCMITKSSTNPAGKGQGKYSTKSEKSQTISQKQKKNKVRKFYVNVKNDGPEVDDCLLMGSWKKNHFKKLKVKDRATGSNITASTLAGTHSFGLDVGETAQFEVKAVRSPKRSGETSFTILASPSSLAKSQQDLVTGTLK